MNNRARGQIVTFYSYKGGVGRTMALANVAFLLARNGHRVLAVDFDLEAPGLDKFLARCPGSHLSLRDNGLLDMFYAAKLSRCGTNGLPWRGYVSEVRFEECGFDLIAAQGQSSDFAAGLANFRWDEFYQQDDGGEFVEFLRREWKTYDFALIDSRTGVTDTGGICTVQLPDVLVLVFTANTLSLDGAISAAEAAQRERASSAEIERSPLRILPLPSRFDDREEHAQAKEWMAAFARRMAPFYDNWLPKDYEPEQILARIKLPYIPHYSFGESLACAEDSDDVRNPGSLPYAYAGVAQLLAQSLADVAPLLIRRPFTAGTTDELQTNLFNALVQRTVASENYDQDRAIMTVAHMRRMREMIDRKVQSGETASLKGKRILWVHDNSSHDQFESAAFKVLDAEVEFCLTTDEARVRLSTSTFHLVISNMRRGDDPEAGFTLFEALSVSDASLPYLIYTRMAVDEKFQRRAKERRLNECYTNQPDRLFELVLHALNDTARSSDTPRAAGVRFDSGQPSGVVSNS